MGALNKLKVFSGLSECRHASVQTQTVQNRGKTIISFPRMAPVLTLSPQRGSLQNFKSDRQLLAPAAGANATCIFVSLITSTNLPVVGTQIVINILRD